MGYCCTPLSGAVAKHALMRQQASDALRSARGTGTKPGLLVPTLLHTTRAAAYILVGEAVEGLGMGLGQHIGPLGGHGVAGSRGSGGSGKGEPAAWADPDRRVSGQQVLPQ